MPAWNNVEQGIVARKVVTVGDSRLLIGGRAAFCLPALGESTYRLAVCWVAEVGEFSGSGV